MQPEVDDIITIQWRALANMTVAPPFVEDKVLGPYIVASRDFRGYISIRDPFHKAGEAERIYLNPDYYNIVVVGHRDSSSSI
jgi:hypothetical protein